MSDTRPPLEYLITCSEAGLESFELSRMNQAANLRKTLRQIVEQWIESEVDAHVARMLESRRGPFADRSESVAELPGPTLFEQLTIPFLPSVGDSSSAADRRECATVRDVGKVVARPAPMIESEIGALRELERLAGRQANRLGPPRSEHAVRHARESSTIRMARGVARMEVAPDGALPEHAPESTSRPPSCGDSQAHLPRGCAA